MISVVIPVYNRENTIKRCLNSVCNQTYKDIEVIVVDDASKDNSVSLVREMAEKDKRIKLFVLDTNRGASGARNYGIDQCSGEYIAFNDSDDEWHRDKLDLQMKILQQKKSDIVFSAFNLNINNMKYKIPNINYKEGFISYDLLLDGNIVSPQTVLGKGEVIKRHKYDTSLRMYEDWMQMIDITRSGCKVYYYDKVLVEVYRQQNSLSNNVAGITQSAHQILKYFEKDVYAFKKLYNVFMREFTAMGIVTQEDKCEIVTLDTSSQKQPAAGENLYESRKNIASTYQDKVDVTIAVVAYKRYNEVVACVESILQNTSDINYKLILVCNRPENDDGKIFAYFKSVKHKNKLIIDITKNMGAPFAYSQIMKHIEGKYFVHVTDDLVLTPNWLSNMIRCAESDKTIGMVNPVSSNVSNYQGVNLKFSDYNELLQVAKEYNVSNPAKWHERIRLVTLGTLFTRECLEAIGNIFDVGFFHDFGDDDVSFRVRRAGYKCILAKDTWIHHNHDFFNRNDENFKKSIDSGRKNFSDKYFGLDAWDDTTNFESEMISMIEPVNATAPINILGINPKCGTPILEAKNKLRDYGITDVNLVGYTEESKYDIDLRTCCNQVMCDKPEMIKNNFSENTFDIVLLGKALNMEKDMKKIVNGLAAVTKSNGQILLKIRNTYDFRTLFNMLGFIKNKDSEMAYHTSLEYLDELFSNAGCKVVSIERIKYSNENALLKLKEIFNSEESPCIEELMTYEYVFKARKL